MKLGEKDWPLPVPVTIEWAGDMPYSVPALPYKDQYAGTWLGPGRGGQPVGKIVR